MRTARGFTLIELLVVMAILGLLVGLVGPIAVERIEVARAQQEWLTVERTLHGLAFRAYIEGRPVELNGDGARLSWQNGAGPGRSLELKYLFFAPRQHILINGNGIASPAVLALHQRQRARELALNGWLDDRG
jgi:prepilin-type N-terminal cleavage/methylation domain-containing protein